MSSPRYGEIHARRARRAKLHKLRMKYAQASSATEKEQILQKLSRVVPWMTADEFKNLAKGI